ncbi:MAG TPA: rhodanese-like domain-containing protein [Aliidongia sp.]|nr:rhodanese-like domain-containing protein [Aliidongia sp.]
MTESYAGDISPTRAWQTLGEDKDAVLVDVRTRPEWSYVGLPDLSSLAKPVVKIEWQSWPDGTVNAAFADEIAAAGIRPDQKVLLLCRSGVRSKAAAELLTARGWRNCYNISGGFQGKHDGAKHRGMVEGWQHEGLPWTQS